MRIDYHVGDKDRSFYTQHYYASEGTSTKRTCRKEISANGHRKPKTNNLVRGSLESYVQPECVLNVDGGYKNIY